MPFRLESIEEADAEFLSIPPAIREVFITAFRELAIARTPTIRGPGWFVEELRQNQRIARDGLFSLHVGEMWRGAFVRDGDSLAFLGFGYRIPEFYNKLDRLRGTLEKRSP